MIILAFSYLHDNSKENIFLKVSTFTHAINACKWDYITHFCTVTNEVSLQCNLNKLQRRFCIFILEYLQHNLLQYT